MQAKSTFAAGIGRLAHSPPLARRTLPLFGSVPSRGKLTMENYLSNSFKLDQIGYFNHASVRKELELIKEIKSEINEQTLTYDSQIEQLVSLQFHRNNSKQVTDSEESSEERGSLRKRRISKVAQLWSLQTEETRRLLPSRKVFRFASGIQLDSNFDGGNLMNCFAYEQGHSFKLKGPHAIDPAVWEGDQQAFEGLICPDGFPNLKFENDGREPGFFFAVSSREALAKHLRFYFPNFSSRKNEKMISYGHRPVKAHPSDEDFKLFLEGEKPSYSFDWERTSHPIAYLNEEKKVGIVFSDLADDEQRRMLLSYTYPFTLSDVHYHLSELQDRFKAQPGAHFHAEELTESLEGRPILLLTLSSEKALAEEKPVVFLTCRVHSGETPAQFMLQGILDKLADFDDPQAKVLLDNYVFKVMPVLNPDGVARGYWRRDTNGRDLNRAYNNPSEEKTPAIAAVKETVSSVAHNLKLFVDIHAHCSKRGCFVYGNAGEDLERSTEARLFPMLMALNSQFFDYGRSRFMSSEPGAQQQKETRGGSCRAVIHEVTHRNPLTYTLEANYTTGPTVNRLNQVHGQPKTEAVRQALINSHVEYTPDVWREVGRSVLSALLDYDGINPTTRLLQTEEECLSKTGCHHGRLNLEAAVDEIRCRIRRELQA